MGWGFPLRTSAAWKRPRRNSRKRPGCSRSIRTPATSSPASGTGWTGATSCAPSTSASKASIPRWPRGSASSLESVSVVDSLRGVDAAEWNALAGTRPFVRHEFLSALIDTGCASAQTGWLPQFLLVRRAGALIGAMPLFAKSHSYGEYVFDWAWAEAHERHGLDYYPKLLGAVPFTPVTGRRILAAGAAEKEALVAAALELARDASSLHVLFAAKEDAEALAAAGMMLRRTVQFHWRNAGYADFEDFLARLSHARRKNIRQERRKVREAGVSVAWLE